MKTLTLTLLVAVVILLIAQPAAAIEPLWHCTAVDVTAQSGGYHVVASGAGAWWRIREVGGAVVAGPQRSATFDVALVPGSEYQAQAADNYSGPWSNEAVCIFTAPPPLAVILASFEAVCIPGGVRVEWESVSEVGIFTWELHRDGGLIISVPAQMPGAMVGASYIYTDTIQPGSYTYSLEDETASATCVPTAVRLKSFSARSRGR